MNRRLAITALAVALLGIGAPVAHAVTDEPTSGRRLVCAGHVEHGGYCVSNPVPDALHLLDDATP